jgi:hypothetical protein
MWRWRALTFAATPTEVGPVDGLVLGASVGLKVGLCHMIIHVIHKPRQESSSKQGSLPRYCIVWDLAHRSRSHGWWIAWYLSGVGRGHRTRSSRGLLRRPLSWEKKTPRSVRSYNTLKTISFVESLTEDGCAVGPLVGQRVGSTVGTFVGSSVGGCMRGTLLSTGGHAHFCVEKFTYRGGSWGRRASW